MRLSFPMVPSGILRVILLADGVQLKRGRRITLMVDGATHGKRRAFTFLDSNVHWVT
jgi:hypothetical protein